MSERKNLDRRGDRCRHRARAGCCCSCRASMGAAARRRFRRLRAGPCSTRDRGARSTSSPPTCRSTAQRAQPLAMQQAVQFVLEKQYKFKAGKFTVGYQACDDSTAPDRCVGSGQVLVERTAYAAEKSLIGLLGTFNSGCAKLILPDPEPGSGWSCCDAQLGEHERGADPQRAVEQPGSRRSTTPRGEELRACGRERRLPGPAGVTLLQSKGVQVGPG